MFGRSLFFKLYPNKLRDSSTDEGKALRWLLGVLTYLHILFFMISLTAIGFVSMITELMYGSWAYSCYLTLNECQILIYMIALLINTAVGIFKLSTVSNGGNIVLLFYIANLIFYMMALYFMFFRYKAFRFSGGRRDSTDPKHEKLLSKNDKKKEKTDIEKGNGPAKTTK